MLKKRWSLLGLVLVACGGAPPAEAPPTEGMATDAPTGEPAVAESSEAPAPEAPVPAEPVGTEAPKFETETRLGAVTVVGKADRDTVAQTINSHLGDVDSCYQSALSANPNLSGRILLKLDVPKSGAPFLIEGPQSDIEDDDLIQCVSQAVLEMPLAEPAGGSKLSIPILLMK
ncbi:MAG: AgmX/PglI C-terminal domain-containing protein [Polyangiaceae bacterium]